MMISEIFKKQTKNEKHEKNIRITTKKQFSGEIIDNCFYVGESHKELYRVNISEVFNQIKDMSMYDDGVTVECNEDKMYIRKGKTLSISDVVPMLHKIANCIDDAIENGEQENVSDVIELMKDIAEDNSMFVHNKE